MFRTAEGLGIEEVILCGITAYPKLKKFDSRPPYLADKIDKQIAKTALGSEKIQAWRYIATTFEAINLLKSKHVEVIGLEICHRARNITDYRPQTDVAIIVGNEIDGISPSILNKCDRVLSIPMSGKKESLNVSAATAIALFYLKCI
jgi:tRNA G18 (ribose-2'-O)-methylase SpoU